MFLTHFKLASQPFAERVTAEALWQDDRMRQGLARLRYLAEQATVGLVTGASGVGKSALIKRFLHELPRPQYEAVYLHLTHLPSAGLLKLLVAKLGEVPRRGKDRLFEQILDKARHTEGALLVLLDEAHLLGRRCPDGYPPVDQFCVGRRPAAEGGAGRPRATLRHTLRQSLHAALLSRIAVRCHLAPLTKPETTTYIDFQLKNAGGSEKIFESAGQRADSRLQRRRAPADQQSGHGLPAASDGRKRQPGERSHPAADDE